MDMFKVLMVCASLGGILVPAESRAQAAATEPVAEASGTPPVPFPTETTELSADQAGGQPSKDTEDEPEDLRAGYNQALTKLETGVLEAAARGFEAVRAGAGTDGEARFRATYNLGWVEVKRADANLNQEPRAVLQALHRAADWFREASALRPEHAASRRNLELVLRRALVLADHLAEHGEEDLAARLEQLINGQRTFLRELGQGIDLAALQDDPNAAEQARRTLRAFAIGQLELLTQAERLSETAGQEQAGLQAKLDEERSIQEAVRLAQLEQLLNHLHRARERMGQARGQLRRLAARRAYRRVAAALGDLKRARDQLLDPVARLDTLITDGLELMRRTGRKVALDAQPEQRTPGWLTAHYLGETQGVLEERTGELHSGLNAGLAQAVGGETPVADPSAYQARDPTDPPEQQARLRLRLQRRLAAATPLIGAARDAFREVLADLEAGRLGAALAAQRRGIAELVAAREHFLEFKRLVELLYQDQRRIAALIALGEAAGASASGPGGEVSTPDGPAADRSEYLPVARELQTGNRDRLQHVSAAILDQLSAALDTEEQARSAQTADPQAPALAVPALPDPAALEAERRRLERADALRVEAEQAMQQALEDLVAAEAAVEDFATTDPEPAVAMDQARQSVDRTLDRVEALRRLFFSVIDHLRETLRRQIDLGDRTEETSVLVATEPAEEITRRLGPIAPEQTALAETAGSIAEALAQQAEQPVPAAPEARKKSQGQTPQGQAAQAREQQARLRQAADQVASARDHMDQAADAITEEPPAFEAIRDRQRQAEEALTAALAALEPPQPEQQNRQRQNQQGQEGQQESQPGGQDEEGTELLPKPGDADQLLQGIRDREAQRQEMRAKQQRRGYKPVEKDW